MTAERQQLEALIAAHGHARTMPYDVKSGEPVRWMCHGCGTPESLAEAAEADRSSSEWFALHLAGILLDAGVSMPGAGKLGSAVIDGRYRYQLTRSWGAGEHLGFLMLNPSTADDTQDDPTIRRCIGFAKDHGYDGIHVVNLFALRSTNPAALAVDTDPVGPENDKYILEAVRSGKLIAAWGSHRFAEERARHVSAMIEAEGRTLYSLGVTKSGQPRHPLYLPKDSPLDHWTAPGTGSVDHILADPVLSLALSLEDYDGSSHWNETGAAAVIEYALENPESSPEAGRLAAAQEVRLGKRPAYRGIGYWNMLANFTPEDEARWDDKAARELVASVLAMDAVARKHAEAWESLAAF